MKLWHVGALVLGLGVIYFIVSSMKKTATTTGTRVGVATSQSNALFGAIGSLAGGLFSGGKISAPSAAAGGGGSGINWTSFDGGAYSDAASQQALGNFDTGNFQTTNGYSFTDANGDFIAG